MAAFVPTMDRDLERSVIYKFLVNARNNHIIKRSEITQISNLRESEWFIWAVECLKVEGKTLAKAGSDFVITFSKKALEKFEETKETDWNELESRDFKERFNKLDFDTASIVMDGQFELFKLLSMNLSESLKNFKQNQILKNDLENQLKFLDKASENWTEDIKTLSAELKVVSSRYDHMQQIIVNK